MNTTALSSKPYRFGWSVQKPPSPEQYEFRLERADFKDFKKGQLKRAVVQKMAAALMRPTLESPGFLTLPNLDELFPNFEEMKAFLHRLTQDLYWQTFRYFGFWKPFCKVQETYSSGAHSNGKGKAGMHQDINLPHFSLLLYTPMENIQGGEPMVADFAQAHQDKGANILERLNRHTIPREEVAALFEEYGLILQRNPKQHFLFAFNNADQDGIAHNGNVLTPIDPKKLMKRGFYRFMPSIRYQDNFREKLEIAALIAASPFLLLAAPFSLLKDWLESKRAKQ